MVARRRLLMAIIMLPMRYELLDSDLYLHTDDARQLSKFCSWKNLHLTNMTELVDPQRVGVNSHKRYGCQRLDSIKWIGRKTAGVIAELVPVSLQHIPQFITNKARQREDMAGLRWVREELEELLVRPQDQGAGPRRIRFVMPRGVS